jgi:hypothetical protein
MQEDPDSARSVAVNEIQDNFTRLMEQLNAFRGAVQVIKQKDAISAASQKVAKVWSQELKDIRTRESKISLSLTRGFVSSTLSEETSELADGPRGLVMY